MFLLLAMTLWRRWSFPRARGDVPGFHMSKIDIFWFSPRTRGCSSPIPGLGLNGGCFPRVCGDVPSRIFTASTLVGFSPRMRGCSVAYFYGIHPGRVFPAYAGMFRRTTMIHQLNPCFPRVCGDVPVSLFSDFAPVWFSPRMRGCSAYPEISG